MIYFDNSATGGFKPWSVYETHEKVLRYLLANPGRSGHKLSVTGAKLVFESRKSLSSMFDGIIERTIFTKNCTEALNLAIFGTVKKGGHVITTVYEHNSVLRPLYYLKEQGIITLDVVAPKNSTLIKEIEDKINKNTYLIVSSSASNVTGEILPITEIGAIAKKHHLLFLVDGAQGAGHIPLSLTRDNISLLALAGHKGLCGIMGSGALLFNNEVEILPLILGGTGTESLNLNQPTTYPECLESGTINLPAIASLKEGVNYVKQNMENFGNLLVEKTKIIIDFLNDNNKVKCYSKPNKIGIVSFSIEGFDSVEISDILNKEFDIAVRGGFHCAPLMHKFLNTENRGLVRVSLAVQNTHKEILALLKAISDISAR